MTARPMLNLNELRANFLERGRQRIAKMPRNSTMLFKTQVVRGFRHASPQNHAAEIKQLIHFEFGGECAGKKMLKMKIGLDGCLKTKGLKKCSG